MEIGSKVCHINSGLDKKLGILEIVEFRDYAQKYAVCRCSKDIKYCLPLSELKLHSN